MLILNWVTETDSIIRAIHDVDVQQFVDKIVNEYNNYKEHNFTVNIGQIIVLYAFRLAIKKEQLKFSDVVIQINDEIITFDKHSHLTKWPNELCVWDNLVDQLLQLKFKGD
jgi:hypothetical protein